MKIRFIWGLFVVFTILGAAYSQDRVSLPIKMTWGHQSDTSRDFFVAVESASRGLDITGIQSSSFESGDQLENGIARSRAGSGDVDGLEFSVSFRPEPVERLQNLHIIWADLIASSDPDTVRRLYQDPAFNQNAQKLTVKMDADGTLGFSVAVSQLQENRAIWIPSLDIYLTRADQPVAFAEHQNELQQHRGQRILEMVAADPEATYEDYVAKWVDMGAADYEHPNYPEPGHIIGLSWDSSIHKFGVDRGAGVWPDYGNPDRFRFWFGFGDLHLGELRIRDSWKSQHLHDGLPLVTTTFERDGVRYEVEQFAYPLNGPPEERKGDIPMVLMQKVRVTNLGDQPRDVPVTMVHRRLLQTYAGSDFVREDRGDTTLFTEDARGAAVLAVQRGSADLKWSGVRDYQREMRRLDSTVDLVLPANGSGEFVVKLPSPAVPPGDQSKLLALDYDRARQQTLSFWMDYVRKGAQFEVPEKVVNDLYRATLWHALRLPRRHGGSGENDVRIDLPYSNFAYSQQGTPWPVNQSIYVDYAIYDLRGYHEISAEELLAMYHNNQEQNGHVTGYANWVVYTPGMLYSVAQNYLLSGDRAAFEKLLPPSLKALDWCIDQIERARSDGSGMVAGPLNDGTGVGIWSFNQAYLFAGLDLFGKALAQYGHPRSEKVQQIAKEFYQEVVRGFSMATVASPIVQLRDHTWIPYVPTEARTPQRLLHQWYATDIDTGSVHLLRLKALPADGDLADYLLNDHEDNLYYKHRGIANEPVYNPQSIAYLLKDDPKAVIRSFYSYMASGFSHGGLEPVEHRWTHGQYFGPPSTDGAWAEVFRRMLIDEMDGNKLLLGRAAPRRWLEGGKQISVKNAPTHYGDISMTIRSDSSAARISADIDMPQRNRPAELLVRLRHPGEKPIQSVTVNGQPWADFNTDREWIRIPQPGERRYQVVARY